MEPFEIIGTAAAVLQLADAAAKTSIHLYEIVSTIKNAPKEIIVLKRDIQALRKLLENLENALKSRETRRVVDQDEDVRKSMEGLKELIETCDGACREVIQRLKPYSQKGGFEDETKGEGTDRLASIRWFFTRRSILASVDDLQRSKFLLSDSMGSITLILMLKRHGLRDDAGIEAGSVMHEFDDDVGSAIVDWAEALTEHPAPSETASLSNLSMSQQTILKETDPHLTDELVGAVRRGTIPVVKLLLERVDVNSQDSRYGRTALSIAAETGDIRMVTFLLNYGASVNIRQYSRSCWDDDWGPHWMAGRLPLNWAAVEGQSEVVELLLKHGANPNSATSGGRSALQDACWKDDQKSVRILLEYGADVNFQSFHHGWRPIHEAAKANRTELVQLLLEYNPLLDVNVIFNGHRRSPLHWAVTWCNLDLMKILLENGADTENGMFEGNTPLHLASAAGWLDGINLLLDSNAFIDSLDSFLRETPLHKAARNLKVEACELLCTRGADAEKRNTDGQGYQDILDCARKFPGDWEVPPHEAYFLTT